MMDERSRLEAIALEALGSMRAAGFEHAQVSAVCSSVDEFNIAHNEPSLLRSAESRHLALLGIVGGRVASTEIATTDSAAIVAAARALHADALSAPQDDANAVSTGQFAAVVQGPQEPDFDVLAGAAAELLEHRRAHTPKMMIDEGEARHVLRQAHTLTTGGSVLVSSVGSYAMSVFGTARDGARSSSFNAAGGRADTLEGRPAVDRFGIREMMQETERQIDTEPLGARFSGEVVLKPSAVADLLGWLLGQLGDTALIAGSSIYRSRVGTAIASPLFGLRSRFDAPGIAAVSSDACVAAPVEVVHAGRLLTVTPSLYGSRKTGLAQVPIAAGGWDVDAGTTPLAAITEGLAQGAVVGRLSMGNPAANGDFSGVIKNSFRVVGGALGGALAEVMITGNMARMLEGIVAVSRERIDTGDHRLPWLRMGGLHFS